MSKFKERIVYLYLTTATAMLTVAGVKVLIDSFKEDDK